MAAIEQTQVYRRASELSDIVYARARQWDSFGRDTVGKQLVRATDSVSANLVEGDGYGSDKEAMRFFRYARSSGREARHWLARAVARGLLSAEEGGSLRGELTEVVKMINGLIRHRADSYVRETVALYDPFIGDS
jgi:four helix bundle protein